MRRDTFPPPLDATAAPGTMHGSILALRWSSRGPSLAAHGQGVEILV